MSLLIVAPPPATRWKELGLVVATSLAGISRRLIGITQWSLVGGAYPNLIDYVAKVLGPPLPLEETLSLLGVKSPLTELERTQEIYERALVLQTQARVLLQGRTQIVAAARAQLIKLEGVKS